MSYLRQLELTNFQKHEHLVIDFTDGINVIHGGTGSGKSCVRRALAWLFFNKNLRKDGIRKDVTKLTSVKGVFSSGVIVERVKSKSINRYILTVGEEVKEFNSIGKEIPDEIKKVFGLRMVDVDGEKINLNIAKQVILPFLLDKSGTFRMKLFNQLTGADILDKVFSSLNKDILHITKAEKLEKEYLKEQEGKLGDVKAEKEKTETLHQKFSDQYNQTKEMVEKYEKVNDYLQRLNTINTGMEETNNELKNIKLINETQLLDLEISIDKLKKLKELLNKTNTVKKETLEAKKSLNTIKIPEIDIKELQKNIEKLNVFKKAIEQLKDVNNKDKKYSSKLKVINEQIKEGEDKYKELLKKCKICPVCKKEITDECIKNINL